MPSDRYQQLTATPPGRFVAKRLGLPESRPLRRYEPGQPALAGPALLGGEGRMGETLAAVLAALGAEIRQARRTDDDGVKLGALVFDATGIEDSAGPEGALRVLPRRDPRPRAERPAGRARHAARAVRRPPPGGRAARAGGLRALRRQGAAPGRHGPARLRRARRRGERRVHAALPAVGQVRLRLRPGDPDRRGRVSATRSDWDAPLAGQVAVVTGASRGIGAAIARVLARDGATIVGVDVPAQGDDLADAGQRARRLLAAARHHRRGRAGQARRPPARAPRRRRRRRPQRRRHARPHARADVRGRVGHGARAST